MANPLWWSCAHEISLSSSASETKSCHSSPAARLSEAPLQISATRARPTGTGTRLEAACRGLTVQPADTRRVCTDWLKLWAYASQDVLSPLHHGRSRWTEQQGHQHFCDAVGGTHTPVFRCVYVQSDSLFGHISWNNNMMYISLNHFNLAHFFFVCLFWLICRAEMGVCCMDSKQTYKMA